MEISLEDLYIYYWFVKGDNGHPYRVAGLEIKKILRSPFGDQLEKYSCQMQIFRDRVSFVGCRSMYRLISRPQSVEIAFVVCWHCIGEWSVEYR